jgi:hypothetical protein
LGLGRTLALVWKVFITNPKMTVGGVEYPDKYKRMLKYVAKSRGVAS